MRYELMKSFGNKTLIMMLVILMFVNGLEMFYHSKYYKHTFSMDENYTTENYHELISKAVSDIQNGVGQMNSMLNNSIAATRSTTLANSISGRINSSSSGNVSNVSNNTNNTEIINHFNITGDNPQAIANEVNKILNKQIERREAVWA